MFHLTVEQIVFMFFFFSVSGWAGETIMESIVRKRFVSKGVFKGPYVPVHGVGAFAVYAACAPLKAYPVLVFLAGVVLCTAVEYIAALFLEKVFHIRGWDYDTYPFTKWCHYKKRIALTTSLFFGLIAFGSIYFYWDAGVLLTRLIGADALAVVDIVFAVVFLTDAAATSVKCIRNTLAGIPNKTIGLE
ncbi:MAG: putative ABC transporter permease [Spirochaetaceae bacterium]|jgi:uncharacterized membrane protein|nr:putative ABC transporter permease [Spirochaetaceae bacterium]